jgi:hypothetical protein
MSGASQHVAISDKRLTPMGYQQIDDVSAAVGLAVPSGADRALIQVLGQNVRWRDDGTDPTASVGMRRAAGDELFYTADLAAIKFIEEAAGAEINVVYYKAA